MITLTKAMRGIMDYDDEIHINPDHIKTMKLVSIPDGKHEDETIVVTEIECGLIDQGDDGSIDSVGIYVMEDPEVIREEIQRWARTIRGT